jgi:thioester reductase-like protein
MRKDIQRRTTRATILITGFPRLLARGLAIQALAASPQRNVAFLVTAEEEQSLRNWVAERFPDAAKRIRILVGQLTTIDLGLSGREIQSLARSLTHIFHAESDLAAPTRLQQQQLLILSRLLTLARDCPYLERFCFYSTAFISGDRSGVVHEEELELGQTLRTPYERTMLSAEQILRAAMPRIPISIFRPSSMIGHSRTGDARGLTEGPSYLLSLMLRLPTEIPVYLPGNGIGPFNIVPVDYVVHASWALAHHPAAVGRTFHLTDPNPISAKQAFELLADIANRPAPRFGTWAVGVARRVLRRSGLGNLLPVTRVLVGDLTQHVIYDCAGTLELLAETDIRCPPFSAYADTLVVWMANLERERQ